MRSRECTAPYRSWPSARTSASGNPHAGMAVGAFLGPSREREKRTHQGWLIHADAACVLCTSPLPACVVEQRLHGIELRVGIVSWCWHPLLLVLRRVLEAEVDAAVFVAAELVAQVGALGCRND